MKSLVASLLAQVHGIKKRVAPKGPIEVVFERVEPRVPSGIAPASVGSAPPAQEKTPSPTPNPSPPVKAKPEPQEKPPERIGKGFRDDPFLNGDELPGSLHVPLFGGRGRPSRGGLGGPVKPLIN